MTFHSEINYLNVFLFFKKNLHLKKSIGYFIGKRLQVQRVKCKKVNLKCSISQSDTDRIQRNKNFVGLYGERKKLNRPD